MLLVHTSAAPVSAPSWGSVATPANGKSPSAIMRVSPSPGWLMVATGLGDAGSHTTATVQHLEATASGKQLSGSAQKHAPALQVREPPSTFGCTPLHAEVPAEPPAELPPPPVAEPPVFEVPPLPFPPLVLPPVLASFGTDVAVPLS